MEEVIDDRMKVVKVRPWDGKYSNGSGVEYFIAPSTVDTEDPNKRLLITSQYNSGTGDKTVCSIYKALQVYDNYNPDIPLTDDKGNTINGLIKKPWYISNIDLTSFFKAVKEQERILKLEKDLNRAVANIDTYLKYQKLAEINPEFKEMVDEYNKLIASDKNKLLNSGN